MLTSRAFVGISGSGKMTRSGGVFLILVTFFAFLLLVFNAGERFGGLDGYTGVLKLLSHFGGQEARLNTNERPLSRELRSQNHKQQTTVAFVFAGAARSFVAPMVHESIRQNLIQSLCPSPECTPHIFIRLSRSDNNHQGYDSLGTFKDSGSPHKNKNKHGDVKDTKDAAEVDPEQLYIQQEQAKLVQLAIDRLLPSGSGGTMDVQYVDIGSAAENEGMVRWAQQKYGESDATGTHEANNAKIGGMVGTNKGSSVNLEGPSKQLLLHKVYRTFDRRRYSMYYNRNAAFLRMREMESARDATFDWVVHARLDAFWVEPVQVRNKEGRKEDKRESKRSEEEEWSKR